MEDEQGKEGGEDVKDEGKEAEILITENEKLKQELQTREEKIAGLERSLAGKDTELTALNKAVDEARQVIVETSLDLSQAVSAYRELAGQVNPGPVAAMIKGDTIQEIKASMQAARELVERVKQAVGAENERVRVPAGAPQRALPDFSALTSREKIRHGIENQA